MIELCFTSCRGKIVDINVVEFPDFLLSVLVNELSEREGIVWEFVVGFPSLENLPGASHAHINFTHE